MRDENRLFTARIMRRYKLELIADGYSECAECNDHVLTEELELNKGMCADCFEIFHPHCGVRIMEEIE